MGIEMCLGQSDQQAGTASSVLSNRISAYEAIRSSLQSFIGTENLQGRTYSSAKDYSSQVLVPLLKGCILLDEAIKEACAKLPSEYRSQVDTIDLRESELENQIQKAGMIVSRYDYLYYLEVGKEKTNWSRARDFSSLAGQYRRAEQELQEKLRRLRAFNSSSVHFFDHLQPLLDNVQQGLKQASSSWHPATKSFEVARPALGWATSIDKQWQKTTTDRAKTLIAKVESGRDLSPDELNELGRYLVDNPKSKLYDKGMRAFYSSVTPDFDWENEHKFFKQIGKNINPLAVSVNGVESEIDSQNIYKLYKELQSIHRKFQSNPTSFFRGTVFSKGGAQIADLKIFGKSLFANDTAIGKLYSKLPSYNHGTIARDLGMMKENRTAFSSMTKVGKFFKVAGWVGTAVNVFSDFTELKSKGYSNEQSTVITARKTVVNLAASAAGSSVGKIGGAMIGQALIPIPGVGAAIGATVGSIAGGFIGSFIGSAINNHLDSGVAPRKKGWSWPW
ncbi:hypothetical protein [Streptococcus ruminantium]|uniref:hypothetical protein n=1 Tax=Streptococcus ruminantium TaxID=1917441 RepID=UPI0012DC2ABA|nr:hypothetical protein [Streptococcus ruminantium]